MAAILLRIYGGLADAEIAAELQCDIRTVRAARQRLREVVSADPEPVSPRNAATDARRRTPKTEEELIAEAIAAGRVTRLPPAYAAEVTGAEPIGAGWDGRKPPDTPSRERLQRRWKGRRA